MFFNSTKLNVAMVGILALLMSCQKHQTLSLTSQQKQKILNGQKVLKNSDFGKKVFYLATGAEVSSTPSSGIAITQKGECTAIAIDTQILLTAAHCVYGQNAHNLFIVDGVAPWKDKFDAKKWNQVVQVVIHPQYTVTSSSVVSNSNLDHTRPEISSIDLALIKLSKNLDPDQVSEFIPDTFPMIINSHYNVVQLGYGLRQSSAHLTQFQKMQNSGELYSISQTMPSLTSTAFKFAINQYEDSGVCDGDSGGPVYIFDHELNKFYVTGILSGILNLVEDADEQPLGRRCYGQAIYSNLYNPDLKKWIASELVNFKKN